MREVDAVHARFTGDAVNLERAAKRAEHSLGRVDSASQKLDRSFNALGARVLATGAAFAGAFAASKVVGDLVAVARQTDVLRARLQTATGSMEAAGSAFERLERFAARTPFALEQSISAFVKLKNLGLDPSERALMSYGNTASAMGKSLDQMIEAVADAATGEFERLKEFGIRASRQGDQVTFTFRGVETTVRNSSDAISDYLMRLGEVEFAGSMQRQAETVDGAISNLGDSWDRLLRTVIDSGVGDAMEESIRGITAVLDAASEGVKDLREGLDGLGEAYNSLPKPITSGIGFALRNLTPAGIVGQSVDYFQQQGAGGNLVEDPNALARSLGLTLPGVGDLAGGARPPPDINPTATIGGGTATIGGGTASGSGISEFDTSTLPGRYGSDQTEMEKLLERVREQHKRREELEEQHKARMEEIERQHTAQLLGLNQRTLQRMEQFRTLSWDKQASTVAGALSDMTAATSTESKAMFQINKAAALANAALSAKEAVLGAYAVGNRIGGPPVGAAFAAVAAAGSAAQIAAISSASFGSGTAPSVGATPAPAVTPVGGGATGGQGGASQPSQTLTVRGLDPNAIFSGDSVRVLAEQLLEFQRDGGRVVLQG